MSIAVECKCGERFEIDLEPTYHRARDESTAMFAASKKCPNLYCKLTVYVDVAVTANIAEPEITLIDWDAVKENDILSFEEDLYRIELKSIRNLKADSNQPDSEDLILRSKKLLYLKPMFDGENVVVSVAENGEISFVWWKERKTNKYDPSIPRTSSGYESWTENWLAEVRSELMSKVKYRIMRRFHDEV